MKKLLSFLFCLSPAAFASDGNVNSGNSLTTGQGLNHHSIFSAISNPAMAPLAIAKDEYWRINYFPAFAFSYEIGDVNNFADDLDELIDIIDDPSSTDDSATEVLDRFNEVLVNMGESGYIRTNASLHAPILPLYVKSDIVNGTLSVDFSMNLQVGLSILDAPLVLDPQTQNFITDTSIYLKSGIENKISVGYGKQILENHSALKGKGELYGGIKLNLISLELSKQITRLQDLDGDEVEDVIEDEYDKNLISSTNIGIDLGVVWDAKYYRAGLTLLNINSPTFDYGTVGENCETRDEGSIERNSCEISRYFADDGRIKTRETYTRHAVARAEGMLKANEFWLIHGSLDLAPYDDFVGFENQWLNLSTTFEGGRIIPGARLGYQQNLAGEGVNSFLFGFTFFKFINLDFEWSSESVEVDGDSAPRRLGFAFSIEERF